MTKKFLFILDPRSFPKLGFKSSWEMAAMLDNLRKASNVNVQVLLPTYLHKITLPDFPVIVGIYRIVSEGPPAIFCLHKNVEKKICQEFGTVPEMSHEFALLALSGKMLADGIVTDSTVLTASQYALYQFHRIRIIPPGEFRDLIQAIAAGNFVFWSAEYFRDIGFDIFYQMTHWKAKRFLKWWSVYIKDKLEKKELVEHLRSALLNRFPYILYSRDMVRFYQLQRDYYVRRGQVQTLGLAIGFYLNTFYLMLWGMLDQLTLIGKYARNLRINDKKCGIRDKDFWREFGSIEKSLAAFIKKRNVDDWIGLMADMRHRAAHNTIPVPSVIVNETAESRKSDEEIVEILRRENPSLYYGLDPASIDAMQPSWIKLWRMEKMQILAPGVVIFRREDGSGYMRDPVISLDYDLSKLMGIMDAFLVKLFT